MLGVVSNSCGRADTVSAAIDVFRACGAGMVVHCGDVGGRHVLDQLAKLGGLFVWGDRDNDRMGLLRYGHNLGMNCFGLIGDFQWQEKRIVVAHGDDKKLVRRLLDEQQYDYLFHGHDAGGEDRKVGKTRVVNPGSLHGGPSHNCAVVSTTSDEAKFLKLEGPAAKAQ